MLRRFTFLVAIVCAQVSYAATVYDATYTISGFVSVDEFGGPNLYYDSYSDSGNLPLIGASDGVDAVYEATHYASASSNVGQFFVEAQAYGVDMGSSYSYTEANYYITVDNTGWHGLSLTGFLDIDPEILTIVIRDVATGRVVLEHNVTAADTFDHPSYEWGIDWSGKAKLVESRSYQVQMIASGYGFEVAGHGHRLELSGFENIVVPNPAAYAGGLALLGVVGLRRLRKR